MWWDDAGHENGASTRALAFSTDGGISFTDGDVDAFPNNPGTDTQGAMVYSDGRFFVSSPWGKAHFPRRNFTILVSEAVGGRPSNWRPLVGAAPLWSGASEYSTLMPGVEDGTLWTIYERSATLDSKNGNEVLRITLLNVSNIYISSIAEVSS